MWRTHCGNVKDNAKIKAEPNDKNSQKFAHGMTANVGGGQVHCTESRVWLFGGKRKYGFWTKKRR